ncbi:MAG: CAP domain-containing protein [Myxococcota bacterium]
MRTLSRFTLVFLLVAAALWWWRAPLQEAAQDILAPIERSEGGEGRSLQLFPSDDDEPQAQGSRDSRGGDGPIIEPGSELIVELVEPPATHYGQPKKTEADRHYANLARRRDGLRYDPTMGHAARELAGFHSQHGQLASGEVLSFLLDSGGAAEWTVEQLVTTTSREGDDAIEDLLGRVAESWQRGSPPLRVGIGEAWTLGRPARRHLIALVSRGQLELDRVPREVEVGSSLRVTGRVPSHISEVSILVMGPDLVVMDASVSRQGDRFESNVPMGDLVGQASVELIGVSSQGPKPLAQLSVQIGRDLPWTFETHWPADESHLKTVAQAEAHAFALFQADRRRFGLPEVRRSSALDDVARGHSEDMAQGRFFAHVSPHTGSVTDRLEAAEVATVFHGENIARNATLSDAEAGLMRSIGHRRNILHPRASQVGIGVAAIGNQERRQWLLTQLVARPAPIIDPEQIAEDVFQAIDDAREAADVRRFKRDARLSQYAQRESSEGRPSPQSALDRSESRLRRGGWAWISTLGELSDLQVPEKVLNARWRRLGVGVTQDTERRGPNIVVVLIVGG